VVLWVDPLPSGLTLRFCCGYKFGSGYRPRYRDDGWTDRAELTHIALTRCPAVSLHRKAPSAVKFSTGLWFNVTFRPYKCWDNLYNKPLCSLPQHLQPYALCSYRNTFLSVLGRKWGVYCSSVIYRRIVRRIAMLAQNTDSMTVQFTLHGTWLLAGKYLLNSVRFPRKQLDSSVGIATRLRFGRPGDRNLIPGRDEIFFR